MASDILGSGAEHASEPHAVGIKNHERRCGDSVWIEDHREYGEGGE
jgi:hypothetical protein